MKRLLASLLAVVFLSLSQSASAAAPAFLKKSGSRFDDAGKPTRLIGINRYQLAGGPLAAQCVYSSDAKTWARWARAILTQASDMGANTVRLWAFQNFAGKNGHDFTDLDHVVELAAKRHIRLIMVLENTWADCTAGGTKDAAWFNHGYTGNYGYPLSFVAYVKAIVTHYKDSPTVAMWQIINEGKYFQEPQVLQGFLHSVAKLIKSIDRNHLVSGGGAIQCWQGHQGAVDFQNFSADENIDVLDAHDYDSETVAWPACMDAAWHAAAALGKPLIIGESGMSGLKFGQAHRAQYLSAKMQAASKKGVAGYLLWSLNSAPTYTDSLDFDAHDLTSTVVRQASKEWFK